MKRSDAWNIIALLTFIAGNTCPDRVFAIFVYASAASALVIAILEFRKETK